MTVWLVLGLAGGGSLVAGLLLTPLAGKVARSLGAVVTPSANRWHRHATPFLGGLAIFAATAVGIGVVAIAGKASPLGVPFGNGNHLAVVGVSAVFMFVVGLWDDLRTLRPQVKFILQVVAGVLLVSFGVILPLTPWYTFNALVTLFWFVGLTNAFNLLDNMDGVAAGVGAIASFFVGVALMRQGAWLHASVAWALTGATLGFLRNNFHPATIFMGDAGSLFIGATLAGLAVSTPALSGNLVSVLFVPLIILAIPILDTSLVTVTRVLSGRAVSQGGRDHTAHRLITFGLGERQVALLLYAFAMLGGLVALGLTALDTGLGLLLGMSFLIGLGLAAAYLGRMHVRHSDPPRGSKRITVLVSRLLYKQRLAQLLLDVVLIVLAYYGAFRLKFDQGLPEDYARAFQATLGIVIFVKVITFGMFGVYRGAWKYSGIVDLYRILGAVVVSAVLVFIFLALSVPELPSTTAIALIDALLVAALVLGSRLSFRSLEAVRRKVGVRSEPVLIYGAGDGGELALRELMNNEALEMRPVCFIDDDPLTHNVHIHGVPVVGGQDRIASAVKRFGISKIVISTKRLLPQTLATLRALVAREGLTLLKLNVGLHPVAPPSDETVDSRPPAWDADTALKLVSQLDPMIDTPVEELGDADEMAATAPVSRELRLDRRRDFTLRKLVQGIIERVRELARQGELREVGGGGDGGGGARGRAEHHHPRRPTRGSTARKATGSD